MSRNTSSKSQEEQLKELIDSFVFIEPDILIHNKIPDVTLYQIEQSFIIGDKLIKEHQCKTLIGDIRGSPLLSLEIRKIAAKYMPKITPQLDNLVVIVPNSLVRVGLQFVSHYIDIGCKLIVVDSLEEAYRALD